MCVVRETIALTVRHTHSGWDLFCVTRLVLGLQRHEPLRCRRVRVICHERGTLAYSSDAGVNTHIVIFAIHVVLLLAVIL